MKFGSGTVFLHDNSEVRGGGWPWLHNKGMRAGIKKPQGSH